MVLISRIWNFETNVIISFCFPGKSKSAIQEYHHRILFMFLFEMDNLIISQCLFSVVNTGGLGAIILIRSH